MSKGTKSLTILIGNVGKDPEMRFMPNGKPVTTFSLATTEAWTDGSGEQKELTEWHRIVVFKNAENCAKFVAKGRKLYIMGKNKTRQWTDKDGNKHYVTEVIADDWQLLDSQGAGKGDQAQGAQGVAGQDTGMSNGTEWDQEIPF